MTNHSEITQSDTCDNNVLPVVFFSSYLPYDLKVKYKEGIYSEYARDVVRPSAQECAQNGRARSTKMRWAVKAE